MLEAATMDLFRRNAFRIITGLSVDATPRETALHANDLEMLAELRRNLPSAAFPMEPPPSLDEIRKAIHNLKDPEKRMVDEFFWFWPEEFGNSQSDPAIQALAKGDKNTAMDIWSTRENGAVSSTTAEHNLALAYHVAALEWENHSVTNEVEAERRQKITDYWRRAFNRWEHLATSEPFWAIVTARIRQSNEPNLPPDFARPMRATLPEALGRVNAELALAFAESGKTELAHLHIQLMRQMNQELGDVEKIAEFVLTPAWNRLKEHIRLAKERAETNPRDAASATRELIEQASHTLALFDLFFGKESDLRNEFFDEVAASCNELPVAYHKATGDDESCINILRAVLSFATSLELRQHIEKNISTLAGNLSVKNRDSVYRLLKSIQDSKETPSARLARFERDVVPAIVEAVGVSGPSNNHDYLLSTSPAFTELFDSAAIVLRGISLDAWNSQDDQQTAVAANTLAIKHATSPQLKQRLAEDKATLQQMADRGGYATQRTAPQSHLAILKEHIGFLVLVGIIILVVISNLKSCDSPTSQNPTSLPPAPSGPAYTPPPVSARENPDGNVYRVPSSDSSTLEHEGTAIESERASLQTLESEVEALGREIETDRAVLDRTSQTAVDEFNDKINQYNALVQKAKAATAAFNERVDSYNAKLRQYGR